MIFRLSQPTGWVSSHLRRVAEWVLEIFLLPFLAPWIEYSLEVVTFLVRKKWRSRTVGTRYSRTPLFNHVRLIYYVLRIIPSASKELADRGNMKICGDLLSHRLLTLLTSDKRGGPLIKGSRDSVTADNYFAGGSFWFFWRFKRTRNSMLRLPIWKTTLIVKVYINLFPLRGRTFFVWKKVPKKHIGNRDSETLSF